MPRRNRGIPAKGKVLIIVDIFDWAWDIASRGLAKHWNGVDVEIVDLKGFDSGGELYDARRLKRYKLILVYPWGHGSMLKKLTPHNTVICIAGGDQLSMRSSFKRNCRRFPYVGAMNSTIKRTVLGWMPGKRVFILSHGVDHKLFKPLDLHWFDTDERNKRFIIGWAGRTDRRLKRFNFASRIALQTGCSLRVADFMGTANHYKHKEMPKFYNSIDCLLVTSEAEAHPLIVYESMSCGVPVITTRVGDVEDTIVHGVNGFLTPVNDPFRESVKCIRALQRDSVLLKRMGRASRDVILEKWTWDKIVPQYENLLRSL